MSRGSPVAGILKVGFPRVSGDEPDTLDKREFITTFSPRERG